MEDAETIVPTSDRIIDDVGVTSGTVWVVDLDGGPQQLRRFDMAARSGLSRSRR